MKKKTVVNVFVSVLLLSSILGALLTMPVNATVTHHVYPGEDIQEAINSAQPGDTVFVHEGTYHEHVVVNKSLTLIGEDVNTTIIEGVFGQESVVKCYNVSNVEISGFTITGSIHGIDLNDCYNVSISGNIVKGNNQYGIFLNDSTTIIVSDNTVLNNDNRGVYLRYSSDNTVTNNRVSKHSEYGILLYSSSNNVVSDNTVSNSSLYGIWLNNGSYNIFSDNVISNSIHGLDLSVYASHNTLRNNKITNNEIGVWIYFSSNNVIYHNNFINNTNQAKDYGPSGNNWHHPTLLEGNYWSDYAGVDDGSGVGKHAIAGDGIGDTLIPHPDTYYDFYPLMGMFSDFYVILEEETYHVTTVCNSTISAFQFDHVNKTIRSNVTGEEGIGFCRICIPHDLMEPPYTVTINGHPPQYINYILYDNGTHRWIYFNYQHSTHEVIIAQTTLPVGGIYIPVDKLELLASYIGLIILLAVAVTTLAYVRKRRRSTKIKRRRLTSSTPAPS